jgi:hypothetical protein
MKKPMTTPSRASRTPRLMATLALLIFLGFLAVAVPIALMRSTGEARAALDLADETAFQRRTRTFGVAYTDAIEAIRTAIPRDGAYLLFNGDDTEEGGPLWVRFDLAPRRAIFLGRLSDAGSAPRVKRRAPRAARWVVIAYGPYRAPVLMERHELLSRHPQVETPVELAKRTGRKTRPGEA